MRSLFLAALICCLLPSCSDGTSSTDDTGAVDMMREIPTGNDLAATDTSGAEDAPLDSSGDGSAVDDMNTNDTPDATDSAAEPDAEPGPDNPMVGCRVDADCPADGEDPGVCCTQALRYDSFCSTASACSGGEQDACLIDEQCALRRPGEWTICCHDRPDRNYCAPIADTCQTLVPCNTPSDCSATSEPCCSHHAYYQARFCTIEFFATNPATDCP